MNASVFNSTYNHFTSITRMAHHQDHENMKLYSNKNSDKN